MFSKPIKFLPVLSKLTTTIWTIQLYLQDSICVCQNDDIKKKYFKCKASLKHVFHICNDFNDFCTTRFSFLAQKNCLVLLFLTFCGQISAMTNAEHLKSHKMWRTYSKSCMCVSEYHKMIPVPWYKCIKSSFVGFSDYTNLNV